MPRNSITAVTQTTPRFPLRIALWLLDSPRFGQRVRTKQFAGRLLKQPARQGVVVAQSRLGELLCHECGNTRDRRIGFELLRQAGRAHDRRAQLELGKLYSQPRHYDVSEARHWLELAAAQGCDEARQRLQALSAPL
ncbi:tetratricopeptide repeat protein [Pseudomonas sp. TE3786]